MDDRLFIILNNANEIELPKTEVMDKQELNKIMKRFKREQHNKSIKNLFIKSMTAFIAFLIISIAVLALTHIN